MGVESQFNLKSCELNCRKIFTRISAKSSNGGFPINGFSHLQQHRGSEKLFSFLFFIKNAYSFSRFIANFFKDILYLY